MTRKFLFLDRDGTLIEEPEDGRIDALEKVRLVRGVIPALLRLKAAGFEFVIVSNQDGLGTADFPRERFERAHAHVKALFSSQDIEFVGEFFCPHTAKDGCECRKPATGLLREFLALENVDRREAALVGDREVDLQLANNLGVRGFKVAPDGTAEQSWAHVAHLLADQPRRAVVERRTRETDVRVEVDLDQAAEPVAATGIGFFDHMLEQLGKHGGFTLQVRCEGDLEVDEHHTVEDVALALGTALKDALGDKRGIQRYGFLLPMDETQAQVALDLGARPYLVFDGQFSRERVGGLPTELVPHFFRSLADTLGATLHIRVQGENNHHMVEACFKATARALREACRREGHELPSTKGTL